MGEYNLKSLSAAFALGLIFSLTYSNYTFLLANVQSLLGKGSQTSQWSLSRAVNSYNRYEEESLWEPSKMRNAYAKIGLSRRHIGKELGYPAKLERYRETIHANAKITSGIARLAVKEYGDDARSNGTEGSDLARVREALKHFVRDWSEAGRTERDWTFQPILNELRKIHLDERENMSVLVPGAGLSRLAWEISQLGFDATANELSPYMLFALRYLLSPTTTSEINQHTVHPFSFWFSHQKSTSNGMRGIRFPDVLPRLSNRFHLLEEDFMKLGPSDTESLRGLLTDSQTTGPSTNQKIYSHIVTLFFIDTSPNIITTLQQIYNLLEPGGVWINLGPLLWTSGAQTVMELSLEEVLQAVEMTGFMLDNQGGTGVDEKSREVECEYTADGGAMMRWIYLSRFWVARKPDLLGR